MKRKEELELAKESYESFERLKYNDDFIKFQNEQIKPRLAGYLGKAVNQKNLKTKEGQLEASVNLLVYKELNSLYLTFFETAEREAINIRNILGKRKKKKEEPKIA